MTRIVATGLNHRSAPVELRERFAVPAGELADALRLLRAQSGVDEAVILSTCNRVELYTVEHKGDNPARGSASFFHEHFGADESSYINHLYRYYDEEAVRHLFTVAASLDSMIIGEPQILGQVKEHFLRAQAEGATGPLLNQLFSRGLGVGKRVRTETSIGEMAVSVPYATVELAKRVFDDLEGKTVALLGRGKMSELTSQHLRNAGVSGIHAVNRVYEHAVDFAARVGGIAVEYSENLEFLLDVDILICSTRAPHNLVTAEPLSKVMARRRRGMLLMIDISVPRRIDPAAGDQADVYLFNIDDLQNIVAHNRRLRMEEARKASAIIDEEVRAFLEWSESLEVVPTIRAFRTHLDGIRAELESRILKDYEGFTPEQRERVEQFAQALVNRIGHMPTVRLKSTANSEQAASYRETLKHLFGLDTRGKDEP